MPVKITIPEIDLNENQNKDKAMRIAISSVLALFKNRVFGQSSSGFGNYASKQYLELRKKKYNRTNKNINFVASAEMSSQYVAGYIGSKSVGLGFLTKSNKSKKKPNAGAKADLLTQREKFNKLFDLTDQEEELFYKIFENELNKLNS